MCASVNKTKSAVFIALFAALIGILSQISLPLPSGIPLTLQTFAVGLTGMLLGAKKGCAAVGVWLLTGSVGVPLFSGFQGGFSHLIGPTGGFLIGFLFLALCCGQKRFLSPVSDFFISLLGLLLCHLCGILRFAAITEIPILPVAMTASLPYLPKDLLCILGAAICANIIKKKISLF